LGPLVLDTNVLAALQNTDQEKVQQFFDSIQKNFSGEYVIDLAKLRDTAKTVLPLLNSYEETAPYGAWLKTRMDYLDAAEELPRRALARTLAAAITGHARSLRAPLIVLKEFPASYRTSLGSFLERGFIRVPSLPMTRVSIDYPELPLMVTEQTARHPAAIAV